MYIYVTIYLPVYVYFSAMHLHLQLLCIHTHEIHNYCVFTLMKIMMSSFFFFFLKKRDPDPGAWFQMHSISNKGLGCWDAMCLDGKVSVQ